MVIIDGFLILADGSKKSLTQTAVRTQRYVKKLASFQSELLPSFVKSALQRHLIIDCTLESFCREENNVHHHHPKENHKAFKVEKPYLPSKSFLCGPHFIRQRQVPHWSRVVYGFFFPILVSYRLDCQ